MEQLISAASSARNHAYAPYSNYKVGAAVLGTNGKVYAACNVENASYGLSICAERAALFAMIADGCQKATACAVLTQDAATPCGACRQVLQEFAENPNTFQVITIDTNETKTTHTLTSLLPHPFEI